MPAKTERQRRYMAMCAHSKHPPKGCPSRKVAREFSFKKKKHRMPKKDKNGYY